MSKLLLGGILGVLLILLGVMSWTVSPHPPKIEQAKPPANPQSATREAELKQTAQTLKAESGGKKSQVLLPDPGPSGKMKRMPPAPKSASKSGMQITNHWTWDRKPGSEGVKELEAKSESQNSVPIPLPAQGR